MHVHASDSRLTEGGAAKFFVRSDGSTVVKKQGMLSDQEEREKTGIHQGTLPGNV